jgi:hypothetical protein
VALVTALSLSYDLMRKPVQVADSLIEILHAQESPSVAATFYTAAQHRPYLRPLRLVQIKAIHDVSGGHYWLAYGAFNALLLTALLLLFVRALDVETWADAAASMVALTVLTGLHTFRGVVREGFPINHFLEIVVLCLVTLNLARSRGGWWVDVAAAVTFVLATLTLESGLLVWVIVVAAWASGMRGISRRGVVALTVLLGSYFAVRFCMAVGTPGLEERGSGFLLRMLEPEELRARFGNDPTLSYAYNIVASIASVLFSEPDNGVFEFVRTWRLGEVPPRLHLSIVSSLMATGLIAWTVVARLRGRVPDARRTDNQLLLVAGAVLVANAAISYAYAKHETISVAGAFYALAAFVAVRHALASIQLRPHGRARAVAIAVMVAMASLWAFRSAGVHHLLQTQAFKLRNDWVFVPSPPDDSPEGRRAAALVRQLRHDAYTMRVTNPGMLPRWIDDWWGE